MGSTLWVGDGVFDARAGRSVDPSDNHLCAAHLSNFRRHRQHRVSLVYQSITCSGNPASQRPSCRQGGGRSPDDGLGADAAHHHCLELRLEPRLLPAAWFPPDHATGPYHYDGNPPTPPAVAYPTLTFLAPRAVACANLKTWVAIPRLPTHISGSEATEEIDWIAGPGGLNPDAGIGLPFRDCRLPHVNESGSGGRVTGRGCLFAPVANAWVHTSLRLSFGSSPLDFFLHLLSAQQVSFAAASPASSRQSPATKLTGS